MSEPFVGEIRMFAGNFAPRGWAFCDGQLLAVSANDALFSLLGTTYGGDGRTTFGLPDLRGRVPIHQGQGSGLSARALGAKAGTEKVTLTQNQLPAHSHQLRGSRNIATESGPQSNVVAESSLFDAYRSSVSSLSAMDAQAITSVGGSQSHDNMVPFLCVNFIIALFGIYPSRH